MQKTTYKMKTVYEVPTVIPITLEGSCNLMQASILFPDAVEIPEMTVEDFVWEEIPEVIV